MTDQWCEETPGVNGIAKIEAAPKTSEEGVVSRRDFLVFQAVKGWLARKLEKGDGLIEAYVEAKVAQESNTAKKIAEEAGEIAARREETEAKADVARQQCVEVFAGNLEQIAKLPPSLQTLALAKLFEQNPAIQDQLDSITAILDRLSLTRGVSIVCLPEQESAVVDTQRSVAPASELG